MTPANLPAWVQEVDAALAVNPHVLLTGNVRDRYIVSDAVAPNLPEALWTVLRPAGFDCVVIADVVQGLAIHPQDTPLPAVAAIPGRTQAVGPISPAELAILAERVATGPERVALLVDNASRLIRDPQSLSADEHRLFAVMDVLAATVGSTFRDGDSVGLYNVVFWVLESERDVPAYFGARNRMVRHVPVPLPDLSDREAYSRRFVAAAGPLDAASEEGAERLAGLSDGLSLRALSEVWRLARRAGLGASGLGEAVRRYRIGITDNPWERPALRDALVEGEAVLGARVLGQPAAIRRALDVIVRSALQLTAAHTSGRGTRPRGVLFFAGPTGVGKTELAKGLAELIFGDEAAYVRFDMSEFSAEHAEARLIGAPPGYVGHGAGGELTNAVRQRPFSLLLFDEVEKAHPRILDKFLQVLEDGRLTDGTGATVHFSESLLVFTSNAGMTRPHPEQPGIRVPNVDRGMGREEMEERVLVELNRFFREDLNRPELLNRLGDNIVVFGFIGEEIAEGIFDLALDRVASRLRGEHGAELEMLPEARDALRIYALGDLGMGGRGIGARLERAFVNPLARALFTRGPIPDRVVVTGVSQEDGEWQLTLA